MAHTKMVEEDLGERNNNNNKLVFYAVNQYGYIRAIGERKMLNET